MTYSLYSVPSPLYHVWCMLYYRRCFFSLYAVLTAFYAVLFLLCAVANSLYGVHFSLCTEVKSLYSVPFSCKAFSRYTRCFFIIRGAFFHYTHGNWFSLGLKRGQLSMEVKMAATTRILKKTQFRSFDRAVPYK